MLFYISQILSNYIHAFNAFHYVTMRSVMAAMTSLIVVLCLGPFVIRWLTAKQIGQVVRKLGPETHYTKSGTPTMGGILVLFAITVGTLLWANLSNIYVWILVLVTLGFGLIGWYDDYRKLVLKDPKGLSAKAKYFLQSVIALVAVGILYSIAKTPAETSLIIPFFKDWIIPLGFMYVVLGYFVITGTSNAVNLTDGLDGLAILPTSLIAGALAIFGYVLGNVKFAGYLGFPYIPGTQEVCIFASSLVGAGLGFLWFNTYPAQVFLGDVGALSLGAALGTLAIIVRQELLLLIMGGVFVVETLSVVIQVGYFKLTRKRVFKMAPIHHHYELSGLSEPKIIVRFWIVTLILVLIGLTTLKLR